MVQLRSSRFLSCFYCGKRTTIKNDGLTRNFTCHNCDADNYLDKNGEITDPPVARTSSSRNDRYTAPLSDPFSPSSGPEATIFCQTCLKNQRLFTASIAQYEAPTHLDARAAEKHYFSYRKQLEATYPQVCSDCSAAVNQKIREARYTAQTDHLRRLREQTRKNDGGGRGYSLLQRLSRVGFWVWWAGWILQGLWHLAEIMRAMQINADGLTDPDDTTWRATVALSLEESMDLVPVHQVLEVSIWLGWVGFWWNPYFVQANRGFTRHLSGFRQWYAFQALIAILRPCFRPFLELQQRSSLGGSEQQALLAGHLAATVLSLIICRLALRSITVDTRPLFGPGSEALSNIASSNEATPSKTATPQKGFAASLHQALDEPASNDVPSPPRGLKSTTTASTFSTFIQPETPHEEQAEMTDEMDWQPTTSQHRAFQPTTSFQSTQPRAFGESPTTSDSSPFWYKAPAAPLHPNHRLRNTPPMQFAPRSSRQTMRPNDSSQDNNGVAFRGMKGTFGISSPEESSEKPGLAPPRFFAKERGGEEADGLADLLGSKFGLGDGSPARTKNAPARVGGIFQQTPTVGPSQGRPANGTTTDWLGVGVCLVLGLSWVGITSVSDSIAYALPAKMGALVLATVWNMWCLSSRYKMYRKGGMVGNMAIVWILGRVVSIAAAGWVLRNLIQGQQVEGPAGLVLCSMLCHQILESTG